MQYKNTTSIIAILVMIGYQYVSPVENALNLRLCVKIKANFQKKKMFSFFTSDLWKKKLSSISCLNYSKLYVKMIKTQNYVSSVSFVPNYDPINVFWPSQEVEDRIVRDTKNKLLTKKSWGGMLDPDRVLWLDLPIFSSTKKSLLATTSVATLKKSD